MCLLVHLYTRQSGKEAHVFKQNWKKNITTRSSTLPAIKHIAENFDLKSKVKTRYKSYSWMNAPVEKLDIVEDLRWLNRYKLQAGRASISVF